MCCPERRDTPGWAVPLQDALVGVYGRGLGKFCEGNRQTKRQGRQTYRQWVEWLVEIRRTEMCRGGWFEDRCGAASEEGSAAGSEKLNKRGDVGRTQGRKKKSVGSRDNSAAFGVIVGWRFLAAPKEDNGPNKLGRRPGTTGGKGDCGGEAVRSRKTACLLRLEYEQALGRLDKRSAPWCLCSDCLGASDVWSSGGGWLGRVVQ
jgi:hypothetical protein